MNRLLLVIAATIMVVAVYHTYGLEQTLGFDEGAVDFGASCYLGWVLFSWLRRQRPDDSSDQPW